MMDFEWIEAGDIIIWGGECTNDCRYHVIRIEDNVITLRLYKDDTYKDYIVPLTNIRECMEEGIITIEREPMTPSKIIKRHSVR